MFPKIKKRTEAKINVEKYRIPFKRGSISYCKMAAYKNHDYSVEISTSFYEL
jgi:hypothetical protein